MSVYTPAVELYVMQAQKDKQMRSSFLLQTVCLVLSWLAIVGGAIGLFVHGSGIIGKGIWGNGPATELASTTPFIADAIVFGAGLVSLAILDSRGASLFFSWFAICGGAIGLSLHCFEVVEATSMMKYQPEGEYRTIFATAWIGDAVIFGAGLVSLAILANRPPRTSNDQVDQTN